MFVPRPHPERLERPWLYEQLDKGLGCKLIVLSAPAGFGKTTLLAAWLQATGIRAGWLSLDERDNDPTRFWSYFVTCLQGAIQAAGRVGDETASPPPRLGTILSMIQAPQPPPIESILAELINEIAGAQQDFVLVLDDYQAISHQPLHDGLVYLLEHLPDCMHLVIAGRSEPPLSLALLRGRRELLLLQAADLRFRPQDALALFNQVMRLDLSGAEIEALAKLTEGWIAGLQLAAVALRETGSSRTPQQAATFIDSFSGEHRYVFDYLAQEVLERQSEERRQFLLATSLLERMNASLCNAVTGRSDGQAMLEQLERENLFIVALDQQRVWYRYHHLFNDFLKARLQQTRSEPEIQDLHRRAIQWLAAHNLQEEAIQQALQGGELEAASDLIKRIALEMFINSELITLLFWLKNIPDSLLAQDPKLSMIFAWALLATGHSEPVEPLLQAIERHLGWQADGSPESLSQSKFVRGALAEVAIVRSSLAFNRFDLQTVLACAQSGKNYLIEPDTDGLFNAWIDLLAVTAFNTALAYEFSEQVDPAIQAFYEAIHYSEIRQNMHILPIASSHLAHLHELKGQLRQAMKIYQRAQTGPQGKHPEAIKHPSPMLGVALTGLGGLLCEWNDLAAAEEYLHQGLALGRQWSLWEALVSGYSGLARLKVALGDHQAGLDALEELADYARRLEVEFVKPLIASRQAYLWARLGLREPLAGWLESCGLDPQARIDPLSEESLLIYVRGLVSLDRLSEAQVLLNRLVEALESNGHGGRLIEVLVIRSLVWMAEGKSEMARQALQQALALAEPEGYVRIFVDEGTAIAAVLADIDGEQQDYARRLLEQIISEASAPLAAAVEAPAVPTTEAEFARGSRTPHAAGARPRPAPDSQTQRLSERELEVLALLAQGLTNQEIADRLVISLNTVKSHVKHIYNALDVRNRAEATAMAAELGL
jgi:LuxR family maltose regulon positive regulatory protein